MPRSLLLSLATVAETLAICAPTVFDSARGRLTKASCDRRLARWSKRVVRNARVKLDVRGAENIASGTTYIVMSNHQSHYDVPVLFTVLGGNTRMVAKKELFGLPLFGAAIRDAGFIEVDRKDRTRAIASLRNAKAALSEGTHIWIAPEGTRSQTGELLPFKKGGFVLALETMTPILPITVEGTREILPAHGLRSKSGARVTVTVHAPIDVREYAEAKDTRAARDRLVAEVRAAIASGLA